MPSTAYLSQNRGFDSGDIHEVTLIPNQTLYQALVTLILSLKH